MASISAAVGMAPVVASLLILAGLALIVAGLAGTADEPEEGVTVDPGQVRGIGREPEA